MIGQNYPNPFNPVTIISYGLTKSGRVTMRIYDMLGRHLETLVDEMKPAGYHQVDWHAGDRASGIYVCRMEAEGRTRMIKMLFTK
jgi:flagellar hook assembly protein FlgD